MAHKAHAYLVELTGMDFEKYGPEEILTILENRLPDFFHVAKLQYVEFELPDEDAGEDPDDYPMNNNGAIDWLKAQDLKEYPIK